MRAIKRCFKCGEIKSVDDFYKHPDMGDGHLGKCKECTKSDMRIHRENNLESIRAYDRKRGQLTHRKEAGSARQKNHREEHNRANREYSARHKDRKVAHMIVGNMRKRGKLDPKPCEVCGSDDRIQAHHPDYSKPAEVVWLCQAHHMELHRKYA